VAGIIWARGRGGLDSTRSNGKIERCNRRQTRSSKRDYSDVSINDSSSVIWNIEREYLNCDERYCELGVMNYGNWIRGLTVPSCIVMWVTWQLDTWRNTAITYCDVGDMAMEYVAYRYMETTGGA
jgi:hypothetical protein